MKFYICKRPHKKNKNGLLEIQNLLLFKETPMSNSAKDADCGKYAYAITQTGFKGGMIVDDNGDVVQITEAHIKNAMDQVHEAWDANRETKQSILR